MNKKIILFSILFIILVPYLTSADQSDITIQILNNEGLTQYSNTNYSLNCEEANGDTVTILLTYNEGNAHLTISKIVNNSWFDSGFKQLDSVRNIYIFQFTKDGFYRIRGTIETTNSTYYKDIYLTVTGGSGTYVTGDAEKYVEWGRWINSMMNVYDFPSFEKFRESAESGLQLVRDPLLGVRTLLFEMMALLFLWQTWLLIGIFVSIYIVWHRKDRAHIWKQRRLREKHGTYVDQIKKERRLEEEKRIQELHAISVEDALDKHSGGNYGGNEKDTSEGRAAALATGIKGEIRARFPTAHSLADLGLRYLHQTKEIRKFAEKTIELLVKQHEGVLTKGWILLDCAACCIALDTKITSSKTKSVSKSQWAILASLLRSEANKELDKGIEDLKLKYKEQTWIDNLEEKKDKKSKMTAF